MGMSRRDLDVILGKMVEMMGTKDVLMELTNAMSTHELEDYLSFISRMNDLDLFIDEDEEEDYYYV